MSAAFDGSGYRRRVLAPLRARTPVDTTDPFLIADLDPAREDTDSDVAARLARVMAFLQRERNSAKYAALATELVRRRAEWEAPLLDGDTRAHLRQLVLDARRSGDAERLAKVDGYLVTLRDRFGGIPESRVAGLRRLAAAAGVTGAEFDARLAREHIIADGEGSGVAALAPEVRSQIRQRLEDLRVLRGGDQVGTASLWDFLGLPPDAPLDRIRAAWESVAAGNARRPHDREKTLTADLLAMVRSRLVEGDPAAYTAGLLADVADELRPVVEEHVVLDGELTAVAYEGAVRAALAAGRGLGAEQVKTVILGIARDLGAAVSTGGAVDYVLCSGCGRPEPVGGSATCRYCDTGLYTTCPACSALTEAAAVTCRRCGHSLRQVRAAGDALTAVRQALEGGRPREAREGLARARAALAAAGPAGGNTARESAEELESLVRAALGAAEAGWRALLEDRTTLRPDAAIERARWLVARAADVPGPDGRTPADVLGELTAEQAVIRRRVEAARGLPPHQREAALVAVLATAVDSQDALRALAAVPLAPPDDLTAAVVDNAVVLRWRPSPSAGPVTYRVERITEQPGSARADRRALGTTGATELADAGAPAWATVRHEVTALSGDRRSRPVTTRPVIAVRDIADLRAEATPTGVRLTWRPGGPSDTVTIERTVDPDSAVTAPPRRARVTGGSFLDPDVLPGVGYQYRAFVEYTDIDGNAARTAGAQAEFGVPSRRRPVTDLMTGSEGDQVTLRWNARAGAEVRVYAVPVPVAGPVTFAGAGIGASGGAGASGRTAAAGAGLPGAVDPGFAGPGVNAPGPGGDAGLPGDPTSGPLALLGQEGAEVPLAALLPPLRLVGASRYGQLRDAAVPGSSGLRELIYTPVTVTGDLGVVGRSVRHRMPAPVPPPAPRAADHSGRDAPAALNRSPLPSLSPGTQPVVIDVMPMPPAIQLVETPVPLAPAVPAVPAAPAASAVPAVPAAHAPVAGPSDDLAVAAPTTGAFWLPTGPPISGLPVAGRAVVGQAAGGHAPAGPPPVSQPPAGPSPAGPPPAGQLAAGQMMAGQMMAGQLMANVGPSTVGMPVPGPLAAGVPIPDQIAAGLPVPGAATPNGATEHTGPYGALWHGVPPLHAMAPVTPMNQNGRGGVGHADGSEPGLLTAAGAGAQQTLPPAAMPAPDPAELSSVSYTVSKAGWRRRTLRVQVRSTGPTPRLVLVARPGEEPPSTPAEGQPLTELQPAGYAGSWTMEVTLEGAQLPWGVRLLPVVTPDGPALWVDHPEDSQLVIR
ncbi:zinc ribbon domain-containing protein [Parafrankia sp. FMc2]|uniref:zinc ribbon domain-containing protein n=1 Tax=Parafrankia sp. FMc2 TaxID=3233196 RepID=UPI0034D67CAB